MVLCPANTRMIRPFPQVACSRFSTLYTASRTCQSGFGSPLVTALSELKNALDIIHEHILLRDQLKTVRHPLVAIPPLSKSDKQGHLPSEIPDMNNHIDVVTSPVIQSKSWYSLTADEHAKLQHLYNALSRISPKYITQVLSGHITTVTSPTYIAVLAFLQQSGYSLDHYQNLYWKSVRASGGQDRKYIPKSADHQLIQNDIAPVIKKKKKSKVVGNEAVLAKIKKVPSS